MGDLSSGGPDLDDLKSCLSDLEDVVTTFSELIDEMEAVDRASQASRVSQKFHQLVTDLRQNCDRFRRDVADYRTILMAEETLWSASELEEAYSNLTDQILKIRQYVMLSEKVFLRFLREEI
ncbi:hypothetical protein IQ268_01425 [Oculatella sp. LEGE 06141]|uniref:hypothetical protein n=1 Tax=Oculatella sp. LEGE 06141 TaxID=1828648 RepID=UPI00187F275F|nr:hypothetical protein [Oculatella sp. LEGE 06141]MBE9177233.1 hypothetical protein [Oculatella sp. LEGE 06141]